MSSLLNLRNLKIGTRLLLTTLGALGLMLVFVAIALLNLSQISEKVEHLANNNIKKTELAVDMRMRNLLIGRHVRTALILDDVDKQLAERAKVDADMAKYFEDESIVVATTFTERGKAIVERIQASRKAAEDSLKQTFALIKSGNRPQVERHFFDETRPKMQVWFDAIGEYVQLQKDNNTGDLQDIANLKATTQVTMFVLIGLSLVVMIPSGLWVTRQITRPLQEAVRVAEAVAAGTLDNRIDQSGKDEPAELLGALAKMQDDLRVRLEADRRIANETQRIKVALDVGSNSVMVADPDGQIIYCNAAVLDMMRSAEADIRRDLPAFRADRILGSSFDVFHKAPAHQRNLLAGLASIHRAEIQVGGRTFALAASPVLGAGGERLGTVVEWRDRTAEVAIEREVGEIIDAAASGDFNRRIDATRMSGFFRQVSDGINALLEANSRALGDVGAMLSRMSRGDLTEKIGTDYRGMLGKLKDDANITVDNLGEIILSIKGAADAINVAAQEIASGNQDLSSRTEQQASSLEETASSMEQLTSAVKQNADSSMQANALAGNAQQVAVKGGAVVTQVVETMAAIHQSSSRIADIIGVIDGIAFQTNILALNAAVEAARAGEQGRGFAVVATEVRNLAQRSASAAKEIKGLIADSVEKVETGSRLVDQAGQTMEEVVASIKRVASIMTTISEASREQTAGIEQVSLAVSQMDEMTQQNAALVEQAAAAAESLEEQARNLTTAVAVFRVGGETRGTPAGPKPQIQARLGRSDTPGQRDPEPVEARKYSLPAGSLDDEWAEF